MQSSRATMPHGTQGLLNKIDKCNTLLSQVTQQLPKTFRQLYSAQPTTTRLSATRQQAKRGASRRTGTAGNRAATG